MFFRVLLTAAPVVFDQWIEHCGGLRFGKFVLSDLVCKFDIVGNSFHFVYIYIDHIYIYIYTHVYIDI